MRSREAFKILHLERLSGGRVALPVRDRVGASEAPQVLDGMPESRSHRATEAVPSCFILFTLLPLH